MATRSARATWQGSLQEGAGEVSLASSGLGTFQVSWPKRTSESADGSTSPEELVAAAHSACFSMALSNELTKAGGTVRRLDVTADVGFGVGEGGAAITGIRLTVRGQVDGLDDAAFQQAAEGAKTGCPVSKALTGVDITLDAALAS